MTSADNAPAVDAPAVDTDVLVIGTGPAGGTAALALASLGVDHIVITKYRWTANTPRAHITNQGAMEVFRDLGIENQVNAQATPHELIGDTVFCTSIAGEELGRLLTWGTHPRRHADYTLASPTMNCDIPQTLLEPIIVRNAAERGSQIRFSTEYLSHTQHDDYVSVEVRDRITKQEYVIRAKYLIGADGARSQVAADAALTFNGRMDIAGSMNITFKADISHLVGHRPSVLYWVLQPGSNIGGIGMGLVRMVRPWNEWLIVWGYDINAPTPTIDDAAATEIVRNLIGEPDLDVEITGTSLWGNNEMYATTLSQGRVFCVGDAIHRHPPSNGLGSNTSVQDSYNLAWKLAMVLRKQAGPGLLDTYTVERGPVAKQIVQRANKSGAQFGPIFEALGVVGTDDPEEMRRRMEARKGSTPESAAQRQALRDALELKNYEFNALGVELGQRYASTAIVSDGSDEPAYDRDPELHYHSTSWPGARLPHAWLNRNGIKISSHDLAGNGRFTLLTGIPGQPWTEGAAEVATKLGIDIATVVIGAGQAVEDAYNDWYSASEITESGCILVRPDRVVAWRSNEIADNPGEALLSVLTTILDR